MLDLSYDSNNSSNSLNVIIHIAPLFQYQWNYSIVRISVECSTPVIACVFIHVKAVWKLIQHKIQSHWDFAVIFFPLKYKKYNIMYTFFFFEYLIYILHIYIYIYIYIYTPQHHITTEFFFKFRPKVLTHVKFPITIWIDFKISPI